MSGQLQSGSVFAGFRIERLLGAGGMGEVYLAVDRDLPRLVALKVLNRIAATDDATRRRFLREADTVARLSHPNIITILSRGEEDDRLWIAMEYVDGPDLATQLQDGPLELERVAAITRSVALALDYAHDAGVLHRDVKPANILVGSDPGRRTLLTDFGIATSIHDERGLTETGHMLASLRYAAPERFHGAIAIDRTSDIYSLGCTVFEMLAGKPPFDATEPSRLMYSHVNETIPALSTVNPHVPAQLDAVIARAMAKDPHRRFATCTHLAQAVAAALAGRPVAVKPPPPPAANGVSAIFPGIDRAPRHRRAQTDSATSGPHRRPATPRNRRQLTIAALATLVVATGATVAAAISSDSDADGVAAPTTTTTKTSPTTTTLAAIPVAGCEIRRDHISASGTFPGGETSGMDAIFAFEYAYYVQRSGTAARRVVAHDATNISSAEDIQRGIDSTPKGTRYCVIIAFEGPSDAGTERWAVQLLHQSPGEKLIVFDQIITTRTTDGRTHLVSITEA
ncbi:serine/threonine protein kinase [Nocardia sp. 2]|uniref:non-specific serine/threonine protein kinase n=1 Tax=Nocardia acididurans TaxID=2802282 RepID=A0ABS1LZC9_9NOCA|nr:serine/threonine-protein kinase [Nocardia acididurans]MBL1073619.1 serine/threonine protein kinase [Nocardia acididurans]